MSDRYINPFADYGFKKLFGTEANKDLLISLLNAIIADDDPISDLTYGNVEQIGEIIGTRTNYFDVYCYTQSGRRFIVEMQNNWRPYFKDRTVYYVAKPIRDQGDVRIQSSDNLAYLNKKIQRAKEEWKEMEEKHEREFKKSRKEWNYRLEDVYLIAIMDFKLPHKEYPNDSYFHKIKLMDVEDHHVFYDKLTLIYIEMPKLQYADFQLDNMRDKWMYALDCLYNYGIYPEELQEDIFKKLFQQAELANFTPEQQLNYERSRKVYLDIYADLEGAKILGLEEGKEEARLAIARKMSQNGLDYATIEQLTGVTEEKLSKPTPSPSPS